MTTEYDTGYIRGHDPGRVTVIKVGDRWRVIFHRFCGPQEMLEEFETLERAREFGWMISREKSTERRCRR